MKKLATILVWGLFLLASASMVFSQDIVRKVVEVPKVDPAESIVIDGVMNEAAWGDAAHADLITATGYEIWTNKYYRESLTEPDYDEFTGRLLWAKDTLYVFLHIDEIVNDSTDLYWGGQWTGDQLFVALSSRLGVDLQGWYDGNVYAAPEGPYHFLIMGDQLTLNAGNPTGKPEEYQCSEADTLPVVYDAGAIARMATVIDKANGVWDVELAIYHPNVTAYGSVGFNIGGSTGSEQAHQVYGDAYAYYCWQPNVPDDPYANPTGENDPGYYTLVTSAYWAILNFVTGTTAVESPGDDSGIPARFALRQNYPNPFNPGTTIRFDVTKSGPITLKVYNALGQLVATLIDAKPFAPGSYTVTWNAGPLASGVYLYQLEAGGVVETRKMLLMK
jgi:hypothetical protein